MTLAIAFAGAAAVGSVARWWCSRFNRVGRPVGTLAVNVVSAFALGLLVGASGNTATIIGVALLGSLSTFATVVKEISGELETHRYGGALLYLGATVVLGVMAASAGIAIG
jgi:CrcB protein